MKVQLVQNEKLTSAALFRQLIPSGGSTTLVCSLILGMWRFRWKMRERFKRIEVSPKRRMWSETIEERTSTLERGREGEALAPPPDRESPGLEDLRGSAVGSQYVSPLAGAVVPECGIGPAGQSLAGAEAGAAAHRETGKEDSAEG